MPEIRKDLYHQIIDSLKQNKNIGFRIDEIKHFSTNRIIFYHFKKDEEYEDKEYDIITNFKIYPKHPIYNITTLNGLIDNLLPELEPVEKKKAETYTFKQHFRKKERLKVGRMVFESEYYIPLIEKESGQNKSFPFNICCIVEMFPERDYLISGNSKCSSIKHFYDLNMQSEIPWHLEYAINI